MMMPQHAVLSGMWSAHELHRVGKKFLKPMRLHVSETQPTRKVRLEKSMALKKRRTLLGFKTIVKNRWAKLSTWCSKRAAIHTAVFLVHTEERNLGPRHSCNGMVHSKERPIKSGTGGSLHKAKCDYDDAQEC